MGELGGRILDGVIAAKQALPNLAAAAGSATAQLGAQLGGAIGTLMDPTQWDITSPRRLKELPTTPSLRVVDANGRGLGGKRLKMWLYNIDDASRTCLSVGENISDAVLLSTPVHELPECVLRAIRDVTYRDAIVEMRRTRTDAIVTGA